MYHTAAYFSSALANVANTDIPAATDDVLFIQNGHFIPQQDLQIQLASVGAVTLTRARLTSPSIKQVFPDYIRPINTVIPFASQPKCDQLFVRPLTARALEELAVEATDSAAGPNNFYAFLWLTNGIEPIPPGAVYRFRATSTTTATANAWTTLAYTLESQLIAGQYAVVAIECISTTCLAARLIFDNQYWRPGCVGLNTVAQEWPDYLYRYPLGVMGRFVTTNAPRIQVFCSAADASFEIYLHTIRVSPIPTAM